jgi:hypothetical protein
VLIFVSFVSFVSVVCRFSFSSHCSYFPAPKPYLDLKRFHFDVRRARCEHTPLLISHQLLHLIDFVHKKRSDENRIDVSYVLSRFPEEYAFPMDSIRFV